MSAEDDALRDAPAAERSAPATGPVLQETAWGYIIRTTDAEHRLRLISGMAARFSGALLLLAAAGLWLLPEALHGQDVLGVKIATTVMFSVLGGYLVWIGRHTHTPEFRIDRHHNEIRIGHRGAGEAFHQTARVDFASVSSVFLLRASDRPTRLFLRLVDLDTGIEIGAGSLTRMEMLKDRLAEDLAPRLARPTVTPRRVAPPRAAA